MYVIIHIVCIIMKHWCWVRNLTYNFQSKVHIRFCFQLNLHRSVVYKSVDTCCVHKSFNQHKLIINKHLIMHHLCSQTVNIMFGYGREFLQKSWPTTLTSILQSPEMHGLHKNWWRNTRIYYEHKRHSALAVYDPQRDLTGIVMDVTFWPTTVVCSTTLVRTLIQVLSCFLRVFIAKNGFK